MRYHHSYDSSVTAEFGTTYRCDHPVYSECTLFRVGKKGLAIIRQRYDPKDKSTRWGPIEHGLARDIYLAKGFYEYFMERSGEEKDGLYPTVTVRQIMWALRMKPLAKEKWETVFDRRDI